MKEVTSIPLYSIHRRNLRLPKLHSKVKTGIMIVPSIALLLSQSKAAAGAKPAFPFSSMSSPGAEDRAYNKYDKYPPYCSTPEEMEKRGVPPLQGDRDDGSSRLVHVTALIRHGARTPYGGAPDYRCWDGFWESPETGVWDCDLKTYVSPPAATKERKRADDGGAPAEEGPDFLFEKRYDALRVSPDRTGNSLNGTCQLGQLLMRGYDQELRNGRHLRQAYFFDGENTAEEHAASDSRMRLWDLTEDGNRGRETSAPAVGDPTKPIYQEPNLRYRATDRQRTLMSGQILLRGLFGSELRSAGDDEAAVVRLHTADHSADEMTINERTCPRTLDLENEAYASEEYRKWMETSAEVSTVKSFAKSELGMDEIPEDILDCLMTTICTDRSLPDKLNDYDGSLDPTGWEMSAVEKGSEDYNNMFERVANFAIQNFTFPYRYNDAAYAKLGMGPLWKEIAANILPIVDAANRPPADAPPPKLALFSGHDTTLMPLLATLGGDVWDGTEWAPYAAMLLIEIHETTDSGEGSRFPSGYAFRLIWNGKVLTGKMDGCDAGSELCDSRLLLKQVMPFAKYLDRDCASSVAPPPEESLVEEMKEATETFVAAPGGMWVIVLLIVVSAALGSASTYFLMRRQTQTTYGYKQSSTLGDLSMRLMSNGENHFESEDDAGID